MPFTFRFVLNSAEPLHPTRSWSDHPVGVSLSLQFLFQMVTIYFGEIYCRSFRLVGKAPMASALAKGKPVCFPVSKAAGALPCIRVCPILRFHDCDSPHQVPAVFHRRFAALAPHRRRDSRDLRDPVHRGATRSHGWLARGGVSAGLRLQSAGDPRGAGRRARPGDRP